MTCGDVASAHRTKASLPSFPTGLTFITSRGSRGLVSLPCFIAARRGRHGEPAGRAAGLLPHPHAAAAQVRAPALACHAATDHRCHAAVPCPCPHRIALRTASEQAVPTLALVNNNQTHSRSNPSPTPRPLPCLPSPFPQRAALALLRLKPLILSHRHPLPCLPSPVAAASCTRAAACSQPAS